MTFVCDLVYKDSIKFSNQLTPMRCGLKSLKRKLVQIHSQQTLVDAKNSIEYLIRFTSLMQRKVTRLEKLVNDFRLGINWDIEHLMYYKNAIKKLMAYIFIMLEALAHAKCLSRIEYRHCCFSVMKICNRINSLAKISHIRHLL